jgi:hypothetical protein
MFEVKAFELPRGSIVIDLIPSLSPLLMGSP